jgi:hypothetical protein
MGSFSIIHLAIFGVVLLVPLALIAATIVAIVLIVRSTRK